MPIWLTGILPTMNWMTIFIIRIRLKKMTKAIPVFLSRKVFTADEIPELIAA
jgi:hypothetical protein